MGTLKMNGSIDGPSSEIMTLLKGSRGWIRFNYRRLPFRLIVAAFVNNNQRTGTNDSTLTT